MRTRPASDADPEPRSPPPVDAPPGRCRALIDGAVGLGYRAGWAAARGLPESAARTLFDAAAGAAFRRRGPRVIQLARNLNRVLGEGSTPAALAAVTRAGMLSYARYWRETFQLEKMDHVEVAERVLEPMIGTQWIHQARDAGRGVVLALPHSGNWDVAGVSMVHLFGSITVVVERVEPASIYRRFVAFRESLGFEVLPLTGGATPTSQILKQRLRDGGLVCLMADRDLAPGGIGVTMFGEHTTMPAGPAMLAALTGADLIPVHLAYTDDGWLTHIDPPSALPGVRLAEQVRNGTQLLADFFTAHIAEHPADWHMLQPFWTADRTQGGGPR